MYATKNQFICIIVGVIFGVAWWIFIDGVWYNQHVSHYSKFYGYETLPGIGATIAFVLLNLIDLKYVIWSNNDNGFGDTRLNVSNGFVILIQFWFYLWSAVLVMCNGGSLWIFIVYYTHSWTGVSMFLQTFFIMVDAYLYLILRHLFN